MCSVLALQRWIARYRHKNVRECYCVIETRASLSIDVHQKKKASMGEYRWKDNPNLLVRSASKGAVIIKVNLVDAESDGGRDEHFFHKIAVGYSGSARLTVTVWCLILLFSVVLSDVWRGSDENVYWW